MADQTVTMVVVDEQLCQGHAMCFRADSELFPLDDEGYSAVGDGVPVPDGSEGVAQLGVDTCPEGALSIEQRSTGD